MSIAKVDKIIDLIKKQFDGLPKEVKVEIKRDGEGEIEIRVNIPLQLVYLVDEFSGEDENVTAITLGIYSADEIHMIRLWKKRRGLLWVNKTIRDRDIVDCLIENKNCREDYVIDEKVKARKITHKVSVNTKLNRLDVFIWIYP